MSGHLENVNIALLENKLISPCEWLNDDECLFLYYFDNKDQRLFYNVIIDKDADVILSQGDKELEIHKNLLSHQLYLKMTDVLQKNLPQNYVADFYIRHNKELPYVRRHKICFDNKSTNRNEYAELGNFDLIVIKNYQNIFENSPDN